MKCAFEMRSGAKFHKDWLRHSNVDVGGYTERKELAQAYFRKVSLIKLQNGKI
jgi:hypothetical protein